MASSPIMVRALTHGVTNTCSACSGWVTTLSRAPPSVDPNWP